MRMSHPEPPVNIGYQGQSGKQMLIPSFTAFGPIAEIGHRLRGTGNMKYVAEPLTRP
jgi:hypothetical protein